MSLPTGAKVLNNISTNQFYYLYEENVIHTTYSNSDWLGLGGPKNNIFSSYISESIIYTINNTLETKGKVIDNPSASSIFAEYPDLLNTGISKGDFHIGSTPTDIYVSFIDENAGYNNTLGYYFYYIDQNSDKILLSNINDNDAPNYSNGYYNPTIIFPNASQIGKSDNTAPNVKQDHGQLKCGDTRKLKGNNSNGTFQDIYIGFFIIPNAWDTVNTGVVYDNKNILHTTPEFNTNYVEGSANLDENGVQSIFLDINDNYIIGFEDLERPNAEYHPDMNDILILISFDPHISINTGIEIVEQTTSDKILKLHRCGSRVKVKDTDVPNLNNSNKKYRIERDINISTGEEKDILKETLFNLNYEYPTTIEEINDNKLKIKHELTKTDLDNSLQGSDLNIEVFSKISNLDDIVVDNNGKTKYNYLVDYQHQYVNSQNITSEEVYLYEVDIVTEDEILLLSDLSGSPERIIDDAMLWGDPHIKTYFGKDVKLDNDIKELLFYQDPTVKINIKLWKPYENSDEAYVNIIKIYKNDDIIEINPDKLSIIINGDHVKNYKNNDLYVSDIILKKHLLYDKIVENLQAIIVVTNTITFTISSCVHYKDIRNIIQVNKIPKNLTNIEGLIIR